MMAELQIALYMRLSLEDEREGDESNSISNQRILLRSFVAEKFAGQAYKVREFVDDGYSGTNFERPEVTELLNDVRDGKINCLVVKDFSRFSRDYIEMGTYLEQIFPFLEVRFIAVNDRYDSGEFIGKTAGMSNAFKYLVNDLYAKDISVKVKSTLDMKKEKGVYANGSTPFGYQKLPEDCHRLVPVEPEAEIVRRIFQLTMEGYTSSQIAKKLNAEGVKTPIEYKMARGITRMNPKGNRFIWDGSTICQMLRNDFYAGDYVYGKYETAEVGGKPKLKPRNEWKIKRNHHTPLIDRESFEQVQKSRDRVKSEQKRKKHPLTGKIVCGHCGKALKIEPTLNPYFFCGTQYKTESPECAYQISVMYIEQVVLYALQQEIVRQVDVEVMQKAISEKLREKYVKLLQERERILDAEKQIQKEKLEMYEQYKKNKITEEEYLDARKQLGESVETIVRERKEIEEQIHWIERELEEINADSGKVWENVNITELDQNVADTFIEEIRVWDEKKVEIVWRFCG
ncbi:MAG: recombinase family protein [Clostridiales bacterium]|nr:recombinase family protein [Clostridiales bacterium]